MAEGGERPRTLAEFSDYEGMLDAIRSRVTELAIHGERFDEFAGLPQGYLSKLVGSHPVRRISHVSMGPLFAALGVTCVMLEDPVATERLKQLQPRNQSFVRSVAVHGHLTTRFLQKIGRKGGENSRKYLGKRLVKTACPKGGLSPLASRMTRCLVKNHPSVTVPGTLNPGNKSERFSELCVVGLRKRGGCYETHSSSSVSACDCGCGNANDSERAGRRRTGWPVWRGCRRGALLE